jgi:hypothetical protein
MSFFADKDDPCQLDSYCFYVRFSGIVHTIAMQPFEAENILFIDTEFSDLDPYIGEILSIGMVKLSGEEL